MVVQKVAVNCERKVYTHTDKISLIIADSRRRINREEEKISVIFDIIIKQGMHHLDYSSNFVLY
jgi:hypothetical protein